MTTLSSQEIKTLEQIRQRLSQLTNSLASLQQQILNSDPLPPWSSLHSISQVIAQNLASVSAHLSTHAPLLSALAVYPLPTYPGREQENILHQLLRKKLEPHVEDWVEDGRTTGVEVTAHGEKQDIEELWNWAGRAANEQALKLNWGKEFTVEEIESGIENVDTGLKRGMGDESESESDDDEEEEEEEELPETKEEIKPMALDAVLRFMAKGEGVKTEEVQKT